MNTLERLKELNATTGKRNGNEDLGHWADREKHENMWLRDEALPALIEVVEAAKACRDWLNAGKMLKCYLGDKSIDASEILTLEKALDAALAKLTEDAHED